MRFALFSPALGTLRERERRIYYYTGDARHNKRENKRSQSERKRGIKGWRTRIDRAPGQVHAKREGESSRATCTRGLTTLEKSSRAPR